MLSFDRMVLQLGSLDLKVPLALPFTLPGQTFPRKEKLGSHVLSLMSVTLTCFISRLMS